MNDRIYIQLGRNGDFYSIMPILYQEWLETGIKPNLLISQEFKCAVDKLDFIRPVIWHGAWCDLRGAIHHAKERFSEVRCASTFGGDFPIQYHSPSFQLEHWRRCGAISKWGECAVPKIDRVPRGTIEKWTAGGPFVLFSDHSMSSAFPDTNGMTKCMQEILPKHRIIRLSEVRLPCPTDLLALYDAAAALVVIDTMHLHLSVCTKTPVLAFNTNSPSRLNGSAYSPRFRFMCRYGHIPERRGEFYQALHDAVNGVEYTPKLIHVYTTGPNPYDAKNEAGRRNLLASQTWDAEKNWDWATINFQGTDTAKVIGDVRALPYVNDMLDHACKGRHHKDILVITNADTCFAPGLTKLILDKVTKKGSVYANRWDFPKLTRPLTQAEIQQGQFYPGSDLFAFEAGWWLNYKADLPRVFVGSEWWDYIWRKFVCQTGGGPLDHAIYHERHNSFWESNKQAPANVHNTKEMNKFRERWGLRD